MINKRFIYYIELTILFAVYLASAKSGLNLYPGGEVVTVIWPPAGIALAAVLLFGYRVWPAIFAAVIVLDLTNGFNIFESLEQAIVLTIEPLLGAYLIKRFTNMHFSLNKQEYVFSLIIYGAIISTFVGALLGVTSLLHIGAISAHSYFKIFEEWWVGDLLGVLLVTPFILVWSQQRRDTLKLQYGKFKGLILLVSLVLVTRIVFIGVSPIEIRPFILAYLIFPLLICIAFCFKQLGSVTATFIMSLVAIEATIEAFKHMSKDAITHELLLVQTFLGVTSVTFMLIAASVSEREENNVREAKLIARNIVLKKQRTRLKAVNKAKDDFIAIASHQLQTPPTVIKQIVGLLLNNLGGKLSKKQYGMLESVYEANEKQINVMRDILNVAQIDAGNVNLQKRNVKLVPLIKTIIKDKSDTFKSREQKMKFTYGKGKYEVLADRVKLNMALDNIIENASKYTQNGKNLEVKLSKDRSSVTISVIDQGIGFTKQEGRQIFKKFSRLHNSSALSVEGTGIGLYWAKKIIDMHGGNITVSSKPNEGSTFNISVPVK